MKKIILFLILNFFSDVSFGQKRNTETKQKIDDYIKNVMKINEIPGAALAVVKNGKVIYEGYFGKASLEENKVVDKKTLFRVYSNTKLMTTVGIFQLIEKGKLSLEDKISVHLDNLSDEWKNIKVQNLLTHSSGLPEIFRFEDIPVTLSDEEKIMKLGKKPMQFVTGSQFGYNQTNYFLLKKIIEKITNLTFDDYILKNQFSTAKMNAIFSSNSSDKIANGATKYDFNHKEKKYEKSFQLNGISSHSANGMNITLQEFLKWNEKLDKNVLLNEQTKKAMWQPFNFANNEDSFMNGWGIYTTNKVPSYGFSGGNETAFRKFIENDMTIIFLSNGHKFASLYVQDQVVNHVAGIIDNNLIDNYLNANEDITDKFVEKDFLVAEQNYLTIKKKKPEWNFEEKLNNIGYTFLRIDRITDAINVFELNTKENPTSGNAFDSLAEGYFDNKQLELSKKNYQKSLLLDPKNNNAKSMITKIENILNDKK